MSVNYLSEYAKMLLDKHGKTALCKLGAKGLEDLVSTEFEGFAPSRSEVVSIALELGIMVGDDAPPYMPARKKGRDVIFR